MKASNRRLALSLLGAALAAASLPMQAQDAVARYPDKPIRIVIPTPPGGAMDGTTRFIAQKLAERWKQPVVVDNRAGGNGAISASAVAKSAADGYTVLFSLSSLVQTPLLMKNAPYSLEELTPVTVVAMLPNGFAVGKRVPANTLAQFVDWARARPDSATYGSSGAGSSGNIMGGTLAHEAKLKMLHVPYKGEAPAIQAVMAGDIDGVMGAPGTLANFAKSGDLKLLAVALPNRLSDYPDVPTFAELGYPNVNLSGWSVAAVPAGTPKPIIDKLSAEISRIVQLPDVSARIHGYGFQPAGGSADDARRFVDEETRRWRAAIQAADVSIE